MTVEWSLRPEDFAHERPATGPTLPEPITDVWVGHTTAPLSLLHGTPQGWELFTLSEPFAGASRRSATLNGG
jgi:hypothetical protein